MSREIANNSWQTKWNHEVSGSYTRHLIPDIGRRLRFPEDRDIGISYCRLLLHDTMLMEDAYIEQDCLIHQLVNVVLIQNLQNTFYYVVQDIEKHVNS